MPSANAALIKKILNTVPPLPMSLEHWQAVVHAMKLSPQQARITELVMRGLSGKQIAIVMGLSEATIRTYLDRIFERTNAPNRVALAMRVMETAIQTALEIQRD